MKWVPFQSPSNRNPMREFCGLKRNSESLPFTVLLYGTLPKLLPILEPVFLSRKTAVISMNPIGMRHVLPRRRNVGDAFSDSQGFAADVVGWASKAFGA